MQIFEPFLDSWPEEHRKEATQEDIDQMDFFKTKSFAYHRILKIIQKASRGQGLKGVDTSKWQQVNAEQFFMRDNIVQSILWHKSLA